MIYRPVSAREQPHLTIKDWSIRELPDGDRHLVGVVIESGHDGRVSSKIIDVEGRIVTTRSGRKYQLIGEPNVNSDAEYVWSVWCSFNMINPNNTIDVTLEIKGAIH